MVAALAGCGGGEIGLAPGVTANLEEGQMAIAESGNTVQQSSGSGDIDAVVQLIALDQIRADQNVRELADEDVVALAGSIELLGQITPAIVRPDGDGLLLVAGHKRYLALKHLGRDHIRAEVRSAEAEHSERAAENIVRSQLNPYEEAKAVAAMLDRGYTEDGAAQALGWAKARVTARVKLLALPEAAQRLVGAGAVGLSAVDHLLAIGKVSAPLLDAVVHYVGQPGNTWAADHLAGAPERVLGNMLRDSDETPVAFAEYLSTISSHQLNRLALGKTADKLIKQGAELDKRLRGYTYGLEVRFAETEVDRARAAGVLIEFNPDSWPIIVDQKLYRQLCRDALKRTIGELEQRVTQRETERAAERQAQKQLPAAPVTPEAAASREKTHRLSAIAEDAHGANLDLGRALMSGLSTVDPNSMDVARCFVFGLLGADWRAGSYSEAGKQVHHLAIYGIRYVVDEFRQDVTKTRKDGSMGKLRIDYGKPSDSATGEAAVRWMWKFVDGAKTAGELYGRALVVIAAEHYATQLVVPNSQRGVGLAWGSHKGQAIKALERLAGPHIPASLKAIEKAVTKANADCERVAKGERERQRAEQDAPRKSHQPTPVGTGEGAAASGADDGDSIDEEAWASEDDGDADQVDEL
jgi:ParB/RepB/Spo0J family partition protein